VTSPFAKALVVIDGAATIVIDSALVAVAPTLSVTLSPKPNVPDTVGFGTPEISPVVALRFSPPGSGPGDSDQV